VCAANVGKTISVHKTQDVCCCMTDVSEKSRMTTLVSTKLTEHKADIGSWNVSEHIWLFYSLTL